jgi:hypothetical protein
MNAKEGLAAVWLDTTAVSLPPRDNVWRAARWLVGRHPRMQVLCERVGAIDDDDEGRWPHVDMLADILRARDAYERAWERYRRSNYEPSRQREGESDAAYEARWNAYDDGGPKMATYAKEYGLDGAHGITAYGRMSGGEKRLLRILATVGTHRVEFCTGDLDGLDEEGHAFIRDWLVILAR